MMNYKESQIQGSTWQRCKTVTIVNPHSSTGQVPVAYFQEEAAVSFGGTTILTERGSCQLSFDPQAEIDVIDPQTGDPTGETVTHGHLYKLLFSLYMDAAKKRDLKAG